MLTDAQRVGGFVNIDLKEDKKLRFLKFWGWAVIYVYGQITAIQSPVTRDMTYIYYRNLPLKRPWAPKLALMIFKGVGA